MVQTKAGAAKAKQALIKRLGSEEAYKEHFKSLGAKGGAASTGLKGFALNHERAAAAGRLGGLKSKRRKND